MSNDVADRRDLADLFDQLAAILPGFTARIRVGEVTPKLYTDYGDKFKAVAMMCWAFAQNFDRIGAELFDDTDDTADPWHSYEHRPGEDDNEALAEVAQHIADALDRFIARARAGDVTPKLRQAYGTMLSNAATMLGMSTPEAAEQLLANIRGLPVSETTEDEA